MTVQTEGLQARQEQLATRVVELMRMTKDTLVRKFRHLHPHTWTKHHPATWTKAELARSIAEEEQRWL